MGKTIAEKILSSHSKKNLQAGDLAICDIDFCFGQDGTSFLIIENLEKLGIKNLNAAKNNFCMVIDHSSPSPNIGTSVVHKKMRKFATEFNLMLYDIGCGICHQIIPEGGHIAPGDLVVGADSHTCTYGAINVLATGMGSADVAVSVASGKNWFKVPQTIKIVINGKLSKGVYSKDLILYIIGDLGANGATYKSIEFSGQTIADLSVDARFTVANMSVEMGAKCGIMVVDKKVLDWLGGRIKRKFKPVLPDKDAKYIDVKEYNISKLTPQIAKPHSVDNVSSIEEIKDIKIDQAFLGTCTNGRLEDLKIAARILKGERIKSGVKFVVVPASGSIYLDALKNGYIETFVNAGAVVLPPGCGPCVGTHNAIPADNEVVISTANRNFKGRMGNPNAFIYLASPATVTASAIEGKITDPRKYLKK